MIFPIINYSDNTYLYFVITSKTVIVFSEIRVTVSENTPYMDLTRDCYSYGQYKQNINETYSTGILYGKCQYHKQGNLYSYCLLELFKVSNLYI